MQIRLKKNSRNKKKGLKGEIKQRNKGRIDATLTKRREKKEGVNTIKLGRLRG